MTSSSLTSLINNSAKKKPSKDFLAFEIRAAKNNRYYLQIGNIHSKPVVPNIPVDFHKSSKLT